MFYLAAYAMMNVGAFAVVTHLAGKGEKHVAIEDFSGLAKRQPVTAGLLTVFLLSLIGVPLTAGFFGKFYIFQAALQSHLVWLAVLGMLNSAVAAYYYLRILVMMYMREPGEVALAVEPLSTGLSLALILPAAGTFLLGVFPGLILDFAGKSAVFVR
jgi:NADH-quinone oxidoreductase subunit N